LQKLADASTLSVVPSTIKSLYNLAGADGTGSVQSAFEFQGLTAYSASDLETFLTNTDSSFDVKKHFGPFQQFPPQAESTLDVQYLGAVGVGATNYYYTTTGWMLEMTTDLLANKAYGIDIVSMSYGWSEADQCQISPGSAPCSSGGSQAFVQAVNANFQKLGATGVTLLAATGDAGAHGRTDLACSGGQVHPGFPAASPYITAVGATQLAGDAKAGGSSPICTSQLQCAISGTEIVSSTSTGSLITSGGGFSLYSKRPSYQDAAVTAYLAKSGVTPAAADFNAAGRGYPDVAALGHAYYIELDGQVQAVDGTSASCPVFAGVLSLINAHRIRNGGARLGFANPLLYKAYAADQSSFTDVITGNNKCTQSGGQCCSTGFSAAAGWDATTGLGTPNYAKLVAAIDTMLDGAPKEASVYDQLVAAIKGIFGQ
jgi:tripeptidyl-peptidase-1